MISARDTVMSLLAASGLSLTSEEIEVLAASYPKLRADVDALYAVAEHDEEPVLDFYPERQGMLLKNARCTPETTME